MAMKWKQKCSMCGEWFINNRNDRTKCYLCSELERGETKPPQIRKTSNFTQDVKELLKEIRKKKRLNSIKVLIEEFEDLHAERLYIR
jgi:hypothetical protein